MSFHCVLEYPIQDRRSIAQVVERDTGAQAQVEWTIEAREHRGDLNGGHQVPTHDILVSHQAQICLLNS